CSGQIGYAVLGDLDHPLGDVEAERFDISVANAAQALEKQAGAHADVEDFERRHADSQATLVLDLRKGALERSMNHQLRIGVIVCGDGLVVLALHRSRSHSVFDVRVLLAWGEV